MVIIYSPLLPLSIVCVLYVGFGFGTSHGNHYRYSSGLQIRGKRSKQGSHLNLHLPTYDEQVPSSGSSQELESDHYSQLQLPQEYSDNNYYEQSFVDYPQLKLPSSPISLDDILKSSKGQQIIMKKAREQLLERIPKNGKQVAEEIVEQIEKDAIMEEYELNWAYPCKSVSWVIYCFSIALPLFNYL